ncbi:MAG: hypothetical protein IJ715_05695 [Bacilli bacterium]|nr:hypothetical protein [Bacilli bacterium]
MKSLTKISNAIIAVKEVKSTKPELLNGQVLIPSKLINGQYANRLLCSQSEKEYILDFANVLPGVEIPKVNSRIIVSKDNIKSFIDVITDTYNATNKKNANLSK